MSWPRGRKALPRSHWGRHSGSANWRVECCVVTLSDTRSSTSSCTTAADSASKSKDLANGKVVSVQYDYRNIGIMSRGLLLVVSG